MTYQQTIGNLGEKIAADYILDKGYEVLDRKFVTRFGELDIVAAHAGMVVFIEVKTRTSDTYGPPESSVTEAKMERLQNAALLWMQAHPEINEDWRIDVIAIILDHRRKVKEIRHFMNVSV